MQFMGLFPPYVFGFIPFTNTAMYKLYANRYLVLLGGVLFRINFFLQDADIRELAILFRIVKAVTDYEVIRDYEALVVHMNVYLAAIRFI